MGKRNGLTRREFIKTTLAGGAWVAGVRIPLPAAAEAEPKSKTLRFGIIADVHFNFAPDAAERLRCFIEEMNERKVDFIIQLGDFCHGYEDEIRSRFDGFIKLWNSFKGPQFHVLGNHDMDRCSKKEVMRFWGMDENHYSFDAGGFHFVVLDTNYVKSGDQYIDYKSGNYFNADVPHMSATDLDWLKRDLEATDIPTILFSHYGFYHAGGVKNREQVRSILEQANKDAGFQKVVACFCGHYHLDAVNTVQGIHYVQINSASYHWVGGKWKWAPYKDALYATVTLKPGLLQIEGKKSEFVRPTPWEQGLPGPQDPSIAARISDRTLTF